MFVVFGFVISRGNSVSHSNQPIRVKGKYSTELDPMHMKSARSPQPRRNNFNFYLQPMDLCTKLEIYWLVECVPTIRLRETFGFHGRPSSWLPVVVCLRKTAWRCVALQHVISPSVSLYFPDFGWWLCHIGRPVTLFIFSVDCIPSL